MNDASISVKATEFTEHFNSTDIDLYRAILNRLNITDPYNAPVLIYERIDFLTCSILICTTISSAFPPNITPETL